MKNRKKVVLWSVVILIAAGIFIFSSQDATHSTITSGKVVKVVTDIIVPDLKQKPTTEQREIMQLISLLIRKSAHFFEFMCLGFFMRNLISCYQMKFQSVHAWIFTTIYAMTDEIHQLFIVGRSGQIQDVLIDSAGALTGVTLAFLLLKLLKRPKNNA